MQEKDNSEKKLIIELFYMVGYDEDIGFLFVTPSYDGEPENPILLYSGENHALFFRRQDQTILLDEISESKLPFLKESKEVSLHEMIPGKEEAQRKYKVPVHHVKRLPLNDDMLDYEEKKEIESMKDEDMLDIFLKSVEDVVEG